MTGATSGAPEFNPGLYWVRATRSLVLYVCFLDRCLAFVLFFWPLCSLFFFDIQILIDPLVSSNSSIGALKVSVIYKPIIKLRRFDWSEYNIVKGHMKV